MPEWVLDLFEEVLQAREKIEKGSSNPVGRHIKYPMFKDLVNNKTPGDVNRKLVKCEKDWILSGLMIYPVTVKLDAHGFLSTPDETKKRAAKVLTFIESIVDAAVAEEPKEKRDQSLHGDFDALLAKFVGDEFGLSVLVAGTANSVVDVISDTVGLESDDDLRRLVINGYAQEVVLDRGSCLVVGPGCRHKGRGYDERNVRLFLAFLVGRSCAASFKSTYSLDDVKKERAFVCLIRNFWKWEEEEKKKVVHGRGCA